MALVMKLAVAALCAAAAVATSTVPFQADTTKLPWTYFNARGAITPSAGDSCVGVKYNASNEALGWDFLDVQAIRGAGCSGDVGDNFYFLGYAEGFMTVKRLATINFAARPPADDLGWVEQHIAWMTAQAAANTSPYWAVVGGMLRQLQGIADGFNAARAGSGARNASLLDLFLANFGDEIGDVNTHFQAMAGTIPAFRKAMPPTHCSALIRPTADDMHMAHDTWTDFGQMSLRMYKVYDLEAVGIPRVVFSSAPATIASGDDWYMTGNNLAVQETTNGVMNTSLFVAVVPQTVSEFLRVMVASYLATSGEEWTTLFSRHNSGTYNNQYMVVDWKRYSPGSNIIAGTLWIVEQLPGLTERADVSDVLAQQGYWASYNIPYFKHIFELSGYARMQREQGTFWSYTAYARPEIFKRQAPSIQTTANLMHMMRYNNYKVDEYSLIPNCAGAVNIDECQGIHSSMLSISSRGDLMPLYNGTAAMVAKYGVLAPYVAQGCFGAIDSKIASYSRRNSMTGIAVSGPTNDVQPTFAWGGACGNRKPPHAVPKYDFPWVEWKIQS